MKAIHNSAFVDIIKWGTVVNKAKIQNESNSQLGGVTNYFHQDCCQQSKDTK